MNHTMTNISHPLAEEQHDLNNETYLYGLYIQDGYSKYAYYCNKDCVHLHNLRNKYAILHWIPAEIHRTIYQ